MSQTNVNNFAGIMRECLIVLMNRVPQEVPRSDAFWQAQAQVVQLRQYCEKTYQQQLKKVLAHKANAIHEIAADVLKQLEAGVGLDVILSEKESDNA